MSYASRRGRSATRPLAALLAALLLTTVTPPSGVAAQDGAEDRALSVRGHLVDGLSDPLGIGAPPVFSWQLDADRRGVLQTGYQLRVATDEARLGVDDVWDTGRVDSSRQLDVPYEGPDLGSRERYVWQVRVWDEAGHPSGWSEPAAFETGTLDPAIWSAEWIGADAPELGDEWGDVTIRFDATIEGALGVYLRGRTDDDAYMWQVSASQHALRPHVKEGGGYRVLEATPLPEGFDAGARHTYEISVEGDTITTTIDGDLLDARTDATHSAPGLMGFRTDANENEAGVVHDLQVVSSDGTVLVETAFDEDDELFRAGQVRDGTLVVEGNAEAWLARHEAVPLLRREFDATDVVSARLFASARGVYQLSLNGERVGDHQLAPGWTDYRERIAHQTYDVTDLLRDGDNVFGAEIADGWYAGNVAMFGPNHYGTETSLIAELELTHADGSTSMIATDDAWVTADGPRTMADILDGETYDARRAEALRGWDTPGYDADDWQPVVVRDEATEVLEPQIDPPVRVTEELSATYLSSPEPGVHIYDLGQNLVGHVRVTVHGEAGDRIRLRHAEVLNPDGTMYVENLRRAGMAVDRYTLGSDEPETYEPVFTFHGFRYVEIAGPEVAPDEDDVVGVVVGTDGELVGDLSTSSAMVDQLQSNIVWGMRGNFLSVPTDTPARDERMGWTGDINVFARTAVYNMDSQAFLRKWLLDLRDTQADDGSLPGVAPVVPDAFDGGYGRAGWADAGVNVPWTLWQAYDDTRVIQENYEMMTRFVDYLEASSSGGIRQVGGYDDWLNLDDPTPSAVIDTAFVAKSARQLSEMAAEIGETADAAHYAAMYESVRDAYIAAFVAPDGTVLGNSQTAYVLTITNDLLPEDRHDDVVERFLETLERRDWHLSTGFLGVDGLLPALTKVGRTDVAYRLLLNTSYPSWGYAIERGATTVWERWNSIMPDGSFGPVEMNSFNHYAYGAVGEWMYRTMAGIDALAPGFREILIAPELGPGLDHVDVSYESRYGTIRSAWERLDDGLRLEASIPAGATAVVAVPTDTDEFLTEGGVPVTEAEGVTGVEVVQGAVHVHVGSGDYDFSTVPPVPGPEPLACPVELERFPDVPSSSPHSDAVGCAAALGLLLGKVDGRFDPAGALTRGQMASLVVRLADAIGHPVPASERTFPDVPAANVHARAIAGAAEAGYLRGWDDGTMRPSDTLRRGQFASVMVRLIEDVTGRALPVGRRFPDAGPPHGEALAKAREAGIVVGRDGGLALPMHDIRRDQVASIIVRGLRSLPAITHVGRADLQVLGDLYAGAEVPVEIEVRNPGERELRDLRVDLRLPEGWTLRTVEDLPGTLAPGDRATGTYELVVADDAVVGEVLLEGHVRFSRPGVDGAIPVAVSSRVGPAVVITGVVSLDAGVPGGLAPVQVQVRNRSTVAADRDVTIEVPDGWVVPEPVSVRLDAGAARDVLVELAVPLEVTEGAVPVTARVGDTEDERRNGEARVAFVNPPVPVIDHVDLGVPDSEQAHGLTASPHSGTSLEAGHTRRYTNAQHPGGWFEFDLEVPDTGAFVLRMTETYDQAQLKDYDISIDGQLVHERRHQRTDGGHGLVTYQIVVPDGVATGDTVRIRFEDTGVAYDPSIADVWALPAAADRTTSSLATGAEVTASSSHEAAPDWTVANLVDGVGQSRVGGPKGYSSGAFDDDEVDVTIDLDLGAPTRFDALTLHPRTATRDDAHDDGVDGAHFARDATVLVSDDGDTWTVVAEVTDLPRPWAVARLLRFGTVEARYVRLHVTRVGAPTVDEAQRGIHRLQLAELGLYLLAG